MKTNIKLLLVGALMALVSVGGAQAVQINGAITFVGGILQFQGANNPGQATGVVDFTMVSVITADGDFTGAGIMMGTSVTMAEPWTFATPQTALWAVGPFEFDMDSPNVTQMAPNAAGRGGFVEVSGDGTIRDTRLLGDPTLMGADPFENTPGFWQFSSQNIQAQGTFTFSAAGEAIPDQVPDGGASVALLGTALLGLQMFRRKLRQQA